MKMLEMKNHKIILMQNHQRYHHCHKEKLKNILKVKKILPSDSGQMREQDKFTYHLFGKAFKN